MRLFMMNNYKIKFLFLVFLTLSVTTFFLFPRHADAIAVTVKRVIFEGSKRAEVITIINNSNHKQTYRLGWKHFKMTEKKSLVAVPEDNIPPEIRPVVDMVHFSPRRFTLLPRSSQQVRMMLRMPSNLADGEYRSHLWIRPEKDVQAYRDSSNEGKKPGVSMKMLAGVSMPIIVRKGDLDVSAEIQDFNAVDQGGEIFTSFTLTRQGTKSAYGDLDFICNQGGNEYLLKFTRGYSLYAETSKRHVKKKIAKKPDSPKCSNLTVRYTETSGFIGKPIKVLAEAQASVQ